MTVITELLVFELPIVGCYPIGAPVETNSYSDYANWGSIVELVANMEV